MDFVEAGDFVKAGHFVSVPISEMRRRFELQVLLLLLSELASHVIQHLLNVSLVMWNMR